MATNPFAFDAAQNPLGSIDVQPTDTGIEFRIAVLNPQNTRLALALFIKSFALATTCSSDLWSFLLAIGALSATDLIPLLWLAEPRFAFIEIRPDGFTVNQTDFYRRDNILKWRLSLEDGILLQYGVHHLRVVPPFANEAEFKVFRDMFDKTLAFLWFQQNAG